MMKKIIRLTFVIILTVLIIFSIVKANDVSYMGRVEDYFADFEPATQDNNSYISYLNNKKDIQKIENDTIDINVTQFSSVNYSSSIEVIDSEHSIITNDNTVISWDFDVTTEGMYNLFLDYFPINGKSSEIERVILIDGEIPFKEASDIKFSRVWVNDGDIIVKDGNEIRPGQVEQPKWIETYIQDREKIHTEPYLFHLTPGKHTLTMESVREPLKIRQMTFKAAPKLQSYEEVLAIYKENDYKVVENGFLKIQGEDAFEKSSPTLYPTTDNTSPLTEPYHPSKLRLNMIGGLSWKKPGDWVSYNVEVKEAGLYSLSFRMKQNYNQGMFSTRSIYINGELPFAEAASIPFRYSSEFCNYVIGAENDPYLFYLKEGVNTITLEVGLGEIGKTIGEVEESVSNLNQIYRDIIMITGVTPDLFRDYQLTKLLPNLVERFSVEKTRLENIVNYFESVTDEKSDRTAILNKVIIQLDSFIKSPDNVHKRLSEFKSNLAATGTWIATAKDQPLQIDYFVFSDPNKDLPRARANILEKIWYEMRRFAASFFNDYDSIGSGNKSNDAKTITVWVATGRDQAQILRSLIDDTFTPYNNIYVDVQLVPQNVLLQATLANKGPDVALQVTETLPVDFALRNAIIDLRDFSDFEEVASRFHQSAITPFELNEGVYALPEQQSFPMLFYRKDILEELGLELPKTWDDVYKILGVLQRNNLEMYLDQSIFGSLLYQNNGSFYLDGGKETGFFTEEANQAFKQWTEFYTNYKLPIQADFVNRFRTGEMPIGVTSYTTYNTLSVFAPEISGDWGIAPIPGILNEDQSINNTTVSTVTGCFISKQTKNKDASWEFIKWWTSKEAQKSFALEMESILGPAARYPTANLEALSELPWPTNDLISLQTQWNNVKGIPQVPGGYITARQLDYAFRAVINDGANPRESLYDYSLGINSEIDIKRKEFNLELRR